MALTNLPIPGHRAYMLCWTTRRCRARSQRISPTCVSWGSDNMLLCSHRRSVLSYLGHGILHPCSALRTLFPFMLPEFHNGYIGHTPANYRNGLDVVGTVQRFVSLQLECCSICFRFLFGLLSASDRVMPSPFVRHIQWLVSCPPLLSRLVEHCLLRQHTTLSVQATTHYTSYTTHQARRHLSSREI